MSDIIRAVIAKPVNHPSTAEEVLNACLAATHRSVDVSARKIICSSFIVVISIIISHPDLPFGQILYR